MLIAKHGMKRFILYAIQGVKQYAHCYTSSEALCSYICMK